MKRLWVSLLFSSALLLFSYWAWALRIIILIKWIFLIFYFHILSIKASRHTILFIFITAPNLCFFNPRNITKTTLIKCYSSFVFLHYSFIFILLSNVLYSTLIGSYYYSILSLFSSVFSLLEFVPFALDEKAEVVYRSTYHKENCDANKRLTNHSKCFGLFQL